MVNTLVPSETQNLPKDIFSPASHGIVKVNSVRAANMRHGKTMFIK